jgi:hypothetical protein
MRARDCGRHATAGASTVLVWQPLQLSGYVAWCGHRIEGIPVPDADGRWRLIMVEGEAK